MKKDFLWGVSTSAGQIEGGILEDGRGLSIWDVFCRIPGCVCDGDLTDTACESYKKWKEDIKVYEEFKKYYSTHLYDYTKPYDGIIELLEELKRKNIKMGIYYSL